MIIVCEHLIVVHGFTIPVMCVHGLITKNIKQDKIIN